jgi:hypothetical protein
VKNYEIIDAVDAREPTTLEVHTLLKKWVSLGTGRQGGNCAPAAVYLAEDLRTQHL